MHDNSTIGPKPTLKWQAIKAFLDGVITYPARTAALVDPYWNPVNGSETAGEWAPDPSTMNKPYWSQEILDATLEGLFLAGVDAQLHVDGDLAVRYGLNAAQAFREKHPDRKGDFKLGLAHEELSHQDDWARFAELGVDPIMSFQWAQLSSFYIPSTFLTLGDYRRGNLQAHRRIEEGGQPIVYGSDWPIDPLDEFLALKVAVTRSGDPTNPNSPASFGPPLRRRLPRGPHLAGVGAAGHHPQRRAVPARGRVRRLAGGGQAGRPRRAGEELLRGAGGGDRATAGLAHHARRRGGLRGRRCAVGVRRHAQVPEPQAD
ncbi:hypothetical protein PG987_006023 [Apiospora arundinis]